MISYKHNNNKMTTELIIILIILIVTTKAFVTTVNTGTVGVAFTWNKIQPYVYSPGLVIYNALSTRIEKVNILPQTDEVIDVECGTKDGIKLTFNKIQIGNQLRTEFVIKTISLYGSNYDRYLVTDLIRHQLNVICSKKTAHEIAIEYFDQIDDDVLNFIRNENEKQNTGLDIHFVRLSKPIFPDSIQKNYLALAEERTLKKVVEERKERTRAEKDIEILISHKDSEIAMNRAKAENEQNILNAEAKNTIKILNIEAENKIKLLNKTADKAEATINNEIRISDAYTEANSTKIKSEGLVVLHSVPGYIEITIAKSLSTNQKIYYGDKLPINWLSLGNP